MDSAKNLVENPNTALASESEGEPGSQKATPTKKKKRRKDKKFVPNFKIPGIHKLVLSELTQKALGCIVGEAVTVERPWITIEKDVIQEHVEMNEESEFLPLKNQVMEYPMNEFLVGYIPDESKDYDEFYVCVTEDARGSAEQIIEKLRKHQEGRLMNAVHRKIKKWTSMGSEQEVEEAMIKYNRSLLEVEIESKYPILPFKVQFRLIKAEDMRDGYMELRPSDDSLTISKRRIDAFVQVAPSVMTNEAQTICTYPKNSFTQYEYEIPPVSMATVEGSMKEFVSGNMDSFCDILRVNGCIDLYSNDYENLVVDEKFTIKVVVPQAVEYYCFIDKNLSGNKMVSSVSWHPMWTGCIIASYVDIAPSLYVTSKITSDEVFKAIHDTHPVLFWSFTDNLKPKLILETPRPIYRISCCPYDPNLIVGGCVNGQIIIWDITNKLNNVEEEEILTVDQQKHRDYMFRLMNWMKNIFDLALVRPTAVSHLQHSHKGAVNTIKWMSPFHNISKTGKVAEIPEDKPHSLELITSSEDGTLMIWDLLRKPTIEPGGFKAVRKLKRLKKRPSALSFMESPFKILHLNLKPVYKINLVNPSQSNRLISISSCYMNFFEPLFEQATHDSRKINKLIDRLIFNPVLKFQNSNTRKHFFAGTMEGDFIQASWDGQDFDSGEIVNFENSVYVNYGKYHDGPVTSIDYAAAHDTILTVGGKVFALWRESFKNRPIIWRKSSNIYTCGSWFSYQSSTIMLTRMDGYMELWTLFYKSKAPLLIRLMSNGAINIMSTHPRKLKNNVLALCDYRGSVRLFCSKHVSPLVVKAKEEQMSYFITKEIERRKAFLKWQEKWNEHYKSLLEVVEEKVEGPIIEHAEHKKKEEKKKLAKISPGERYLEMVQEQHRINEQARIKSIILMKKQLDTEDLLKKREPLRKLEEENEVKRKKQRNKLKESDKIFQDQVAMLFPDVVKAKPQPPPDPYEDFYSDNFKKSNFDGYKHVAVEAQDYVEDNPFSYDFDWDNVLKAGRERRKRLEDCEEKHSHSKRYAAIKEEKALLLAPAPAVEVASIMEDVQSTAPDEVSISTTLSKNTIVIG